MEATQQKIIDAAIYIFNDDLSAPLETVADKAGVTRRTLHRYFINREQLLTACKKEMDTVCEAAMTQAYNSSDLPVKQLELMLYAGIDCNHKYAFLNKLHQRGEISYAANNGRGSKDNIKDKWFRLITLLQKQETISADISDRWIFLLFGSIISATIHAKDSGDIAPNDLKKFAWYSFSKGMGLQKKRSKTV
jgi:AcrR family transcriptional regulator